MMYNSDILTAQTQDELEKVCMSAQLSMRADMEHMVMTAVRDAYEKGYNDGARFGNITDPASWNPANYRPV